MGYIKLRRTDVKVSRAKRTSACLNAQILVITIAKVIKFGKEVTH